MHKAILTVPACGQGMGGGHVSRCIKLVRELRALGREAFLFIPPGADTGSFLDIIQCDKSWLITEAELQSREFECIVLDRFQTPAEELSRWSALAPVIGIDEGGVYRNCCDFLIDMLPNCNRIQPNITNPSLLPLPVKKPSSLPRPDFSPLRVLVSFGQEDAAGLGPVVAGALFKAQHEGQSGAVEITLLRGRSGNEAAGPRSLVLNPEFTACHKIIDALPNLCERLDEYDVVITHFGLTAFEALFAGVPALLVSPGRYHEKLAKKAGFISLGAGKGKAAKAGRLLLPKGTVNNAFLCRLTTCCDTLAARYGLDHAPRQSLAELINGFTPVVNRNCPACGAADGGTLLHGMVLARFPERTYRRCRHCGVINMSRLTPPPITYGKEYFFEQYHKQYGKTYIEDFPNLTTMAQRRLAVIKKLGSREQETGKGDILDIGCAYGPFLAAAREAGFSPYGIDPCEDAVRYVTQTLNIPAAQGFFPLPALEPKDSCSLPPNQGFAASYTLITLWYVIEHFSNCLPALAEIHTMLNAGGILAFATPSFTGISGRASLVRFLENSPADHWTIWSPAAGKKALATAGFKVRKIVHCGHHPERFPVLGKFAQTARSPLYRLLLAVSRVFGLGDTIEVYAVKNLH